MRYYKIEVDERVYNHLKSQAEPFEDTPNSVLNRILFGRRKPPEHAYHTEHSVKYKTPSFPAGVPKALAQVLEVLFEMKKMGRTRTEATNIVSQRRGTAPQTIIDKYCRQLNRKAYEIDRLLQKQDLSEFRLLLESKFPNHKDIIDSFFDTLPEEEMQHPTDPTVEKEPKDIGECQDTMSIYRNKSSGQPFIYIEDVDNGKALFVTPEAKIKPLELKLFEELEEEDEGYFLSHGLITKPQVDKYNEFLASFINNAISKKDISFPTPEKKVTEDALIPDIIEVLRKHGGKARKAVVDEEIYQKYRSVFEQPWYQKLVSHGVPRWKHHVAWAKERAKHRGLIKYPEESGIGYWELTDGGEIVHSVDEKNKLRPVTIRRTPTKGRKSRDIDLEDALKTSLGNYLKNKWGEFHREGDSMLVFLHDYRRVLCKYSSFSREQSKWFWGVSGKYWTKWKPQHYLALIRENEDGPDYSFVLLNSRESEILFERCSESNGEKKIDMRIYEDGETRLIEFKELDVKDRIKPLRLNQN